jgi:hypothetical protein
LFAIRRKVRIMSPVTVQMFPTNALFQGSLACHSRLVEASIKVLLSNPVGFGGAMMQVFCCGKERSRRLAAGQTLAEYQGEAVRAVLFFSLSLLSDWVRGACYSGLVDSSSKCQVKKNLPRAHPRSGPRVMPLLLTPVSPGSDAGDAHCPKPAPR